MAHYYLIIWYHRQPIAVSDISILLYCQEHREVSCIWGLLFPYSLYMFDKQLNNRRSVAILPLAKNATIVGDLLAQALLIITSLVIMYDKLAAPACTEFICTRLPISQTS